MTLARRPAGFAALLAAVLLPAGVQSDAAQVSPRQGRARDRVTHPAAAAEVPPAGTGRRSAPLVTKETRPEGLVRLGDPLVLDSLPGEGGPGGPIIEALRFTLMEGPVEPIGASARLVIQPPEPAPETVLTWEGRIARGEDLEIPARLPVTREMEGPFTAVLELRDSKGRTLFEGTYGFGYPRYRTSSNLALADRRFVVKDDFEGDRIDGTRWRSWLMDPGRARVEQKEGRLWVHGEGTIGYNGVVSQAALETRDVEVVCRAGIRSAGGADHNALIHLCGSSEWSPDHWLEIKLHSRGENATRVVVATSIPADHAHGDRGRLDLIHEAGEGHLFKISSDGSTNHSRAFVRLEGAWHPLGDPFEVPARTTRLELKVEGWKESSLSSSAWFDDCRLYPRPRSSYVGVSFSRADGRRPTVGIPDAWPPVAFDASNRPFTGRDVTLRLLTVDGESLVDEAVAGDSLDFGLLELRRAPWEAYPVAAILRIFVRGIQLGPDHVIRSDAVEGLYPDDVYSVTLE